MGTVITHNMAHGSPSGHTNKIECKDLSLEHRRAKGFYAISDTHLIVRNGLMGGKYATDGEEITIKQPGGISYTVTLRSDNQHLVISASRNIVGTGPFIISRLTCPKSLPDAMELFLP